METIGKVVACILGAVAAIACALALCWLVAGNDFFLFQYFAPKYAGVQRQAYENTKSYRQGMVQDLEKDQIEYVKATPEQKDAMSSVILHQAADVPDDALTPSLRTFLATLRAQQGIQ